MNNKINYYNISKISKLYKKSNINYNFINPNLEFLQSKKKIIFKEQNIIF